jgi:ABC-type multidrug transport system ATPase subunit
VTDSFVVVEEVTKRYGNVLAVDNVSLSISRGEVYSLVGANGAGKSTLIKMLVGITEPGSGRLSICGEDISNGQRRHGGIWGICLRNSFFTIG